MSKRIALLFLIVFLVGLFLPQVILAGFYQADSEGVCYDGLVPCGKEVCVGAFDSDGCKDLLKDVQDEVKTGLSPTEAFERSCVSNGGHLENVTCQFCHFFVMIDGIFDFVLIYVVPPIAVLMLVIGGIMFYFAGGKPELVKQGTSLIRNVIIGLFLVYGAFMLVGTVLKIMGVAEWTGLQNFTTNFIFTIDCEIGL